MRYGNALQGRGRKKTKKEVGEEAGRRHLRDRAAQPTGGVKFSRITSPLSFQTYRSRGGVAVRICSNRRGASYCRCARSSRTLTDRTREVSGARALKKKERETTSELQLALKRFRGDETGTDGAREVFCFFLRRLFPGSGRLLRGDLLCF